MKRNKLLDLLLTFMKIGVFTFGGGYAMISVIEDNCVEQKKWITHDDMMNITVIAESTPGPIAINCATFVGYKQAGFLGALMATLGVVSPSVVIICIIAAFLDNLLAIPVVAHAFSGIKIGVGILILDAAITMIKKMPKKRLSLIIMSCAFILMMLINIFAWNFSTIVMLLIAAIVSLVFYLIQGTKQEEGGEKS